jgi:hypothetical protein
MDDAFTTVLAQQLDHVKTAVYDVRYPELKARQLIPVSYEADTGAETITYHMWDVVGMAQIISSYADDIPLIEVLAEPFAQRVYGMAVGYLYTLQDLRNAAMAKIPLTQKKAKKVRRQMEQKLENIAALGEPNTGLKGLANHPNVSSVAPLTGDWANATGQQIVDDMLHVVSQTVLRCGDTFVPTDMVMDLQSYLYAATRRMSSTGDANYTALKAFHESCPYEITVTHWNKLKEADGSGGPRLVCYTKSPEVLTLEIPQDFEQMTPQQKNFAFMVPAHMRTAGVISEYPMAISYMDGL